MILNEILDKLPRANGEREGLGRGADAKVYIDHRGDLCIIIDGIGVLSLEEDNLELLYVEYE